MTNELVSKEYIFKKNKNNLQYVGDFEGLYQNEKIPWGQDGSEKRLKKFYQQSRRMLIENVKNYKNNKILEIGCGLGYVLNELDTAIPGKKLTGMDISPTAIKKAKTLFPQYKFIASDISSINCFNFLNENTYNIIILGQMLWYILEKLPQVFENCEKLLTKNGHLIIAHGFLQNQKYGKNIIDGFDGLIKYVSIKALSNFKFIKGEIKYSGYPLDSGIVILQKR